MALTLSTSNCRRYSRISYSIAAFKPQYSPYLAPGYALFEGLFIGGVSAIFEAKYPGIVTQAVANS
jgi:uncharacterized YccA/Bax inhibitor family protein